MARKKVATDSKLSSKTKDEIYITNHMKGVWIMPPEIRHGMTPSEIPDVKNRRAVITMHPKAVRPNETVLANKSAFDTYYAKSEAFKAMVDEKYIVVAKKKKHVEDLKAINEAKPPADLLPENDQKTSSKVSSTSGSLPLTPENMSKVEPIRSN